MLFERMHRYLVLIVAFVVSFSFATSVYALQGGPDKFGYRYIDSQERSGPTYSMQRFGEDIVKLEGKNAIGDDSITVAYPIGFSFEFYGVKYRNFHISDNGYIVFNASMPQAEMHGFTYNGEPVPSPAYPNRILAPLWGDNAGTA